jgi:hypothetical protein
MTATLRRRQTLAVALAVAVIAAIVLTTRPASPDAGADLADGTIVEVDDGLVYFIWEGGKQRIQQPAALDDHDLDELGLTIGDPAPDDLVVGEEGSAFVMYPSDGPDSKLHLMDGDTLHELRIVATAEATVADLPDLEDLVVHRVRIR